MRPMTPQIIPHLWFDTQAEEAVQFYTSLFKNSKTGAMTRYSSEGFEIHGQPEGQVMTIDFELDHCPFIALNGGPYFKFTPAISFFVVCETEAEVDTLWQALSTDGMALMPLSKYPWSAKYGWVQDRFGLSWQLTLGKLDDVGQKISPVLMYTGPQNGRADEAMQLYTSLFGDSSIAAISRYAPGEGDREGSIKHARFRLSGETFMAMDSTGPHAFNFNEAISFLIACESQEEVDFFWSRLTVGGDPSAQQCGWLKDRFGVSWQVIPKELQEMLHDPDRQKFARVVKAFLHMKKIDLPTLRRAYSGE